MSNYIASTFNAETDEDRPRLGHQIELSEGEYFEIKEVSWAFTSKVFEEVIADVPTGMFDPKKYDLCVSKQHATRPGVTWLVYVNRVK